MVELADEHKVPTSFVDSWKRFFLGKPLINEDLEHESLSNPVAVGVLSPDPVSSTAYGPEQILIELLPAAGLAAFTLILPLGGIILLILALVTASYRQVVMVYTQRGGSYVVARSNFGPKIAQLSSAALLIDYVVTVAIQCSAGTVALVSAVPSLGSYHLEITLGALLLLSFGNLRGVKEAGRLFAVPVYAFATMMTTLIVTGVVREIMGNLPTYDPEHIPGAVSIHHGNGIVMGATILILLRSFANGGTSLTGVEAIADAVNVFQQPQGPNARKALTMMACLLGFLLFGVIWLAHVTHATPYAAGYPSMLSEIARAVFGSGTIGNVLFVLLQAASAIILFFGANTSFNGFPALTSFVAEDSFLPRPMMKRGHKLVFSNAILVLTAASTALVLVTDGSVDAVVPLYAMGVFMGFSICGYGMTKYHLRNRAPGWRSKLVINLSAAILSTIIVLIFAIAKFTEGAWLVCVVFPILVVALMRLNREYRSESAVLEMQLTEPQDLQKHPHHTVVVLVDHFDFATIEALHYASGLNADKLSAVHFVIDARHAQRLQDRWEHFEDDIPLQMHECPDRHLSRAAQELVCGEIENDPSTKVTVLLPRRTYAPLVGRLLHDRTADKMAGAVSRVEGATAQIVAYDVGSRIAQATAVARAEKVSTKANASVTGGAAT
ncbi:APC family permease [Candidatus Mycobacterium wuenschmannii]|uniref:APC family permease n=1 Tax=Candidatus Mycobacterium wuenschmannii TaxID=3027808 RepID=A0ABY8VXC5_9MYCO|nr:APC family permease [Candidatus Mycobacterium wuenschmannii]WIM88278.1 APC family permease [Candidatus Mycobacterium wuenschmannii]